MEFLAFLVDELRKKWENINMGNPLNVLGEFLTYLEYFWHNF